MGLEQDLAASDEVKGVLLNEYGERAMHCEVMREGPFDASTSP